MKHLKIIILILLVAPALYSQHYWGVSVDAGFAGQHDDIALTHSKLGGLGGVNANYMLRYNHFIIQTGLGFRFSGVVQMVDSLTQIQDLHCTAYLSEFRLPIMVGVSFSDFYAMVGASAAYVFRATSQQTGTYLPTLETDKYFSDYNQAFTHLDINCKSHLWNHPDVRVSFEIGYRLPTYHSTQHAIHHYVACFAEYGLLNTMPSQAKPLIMPNTNASVDNIRVEHIYATYSSQQAASHNWCVGLRYSLYVPVANISRSSCMCIYF